MRGLKTFSKYDPNAEQIPSGVTARAAAETTLLKRMADEALKKVARIGKPQIRLCSGRGPLPRDSTKWLLLTVAPVAAILLWSRLNRFRE
jgi:hypothetical protein